MYMQIGNYIEYTCTGKSISLFSMEETQIIIIAMPNFVTQYIYTSII